LRENYGALGSWPLALTVYNHGAAGMRRARDTVGTDDFVKINRTYNSRTFGFASRNFFPSFLAALTIDENPEKYFGALDRRPEIKFNELSMPAFVRLATLERTLGLDRDSAIVAHLFDERDPAVKKLLAMAIQAAKRKGKYIGICGQGPSDHPDLAEWLMDQGIESLSLNPDTVVATWLALAEPPPQRRSAAA